MKINTKEMRSVANFFAKMDKKGGRINMRKINSSTNKTDKCKTPACVGGWLAVYYDTVKNENKCRNYIDGVDKFFKKLGFEDKIDFLKIWVKKNKKIWGNCSGRYMFEYNYAWEEEGEYGYKRHRSGNLTLSHVAYKLHKVADRIDKAYV